MVIETAVLCLAMNIFFESRGEPIPGQYAVALVTMNRAKQEPAKVCSVVFKPKQFSWTGSVKPVRNGWVIPPHMTAPTQKESDAWAKAVRIASWTLAGRMPDFTQGANFYHAKSVAPSWRKVMTRTKTIGAHHFYRH